jgi:hypothetical protein
MLVEYIKTNFQESGFEFRVSAAALMRLSTKHILRCHTCKLGKPVEVCGDSAAFAPNGLASDNTVDSGPVSAGSLFTLTEIS